MEIVEEVRATVATAKALTSNQVRAWTMDERRQALSALDDLTRIAALTKARILTVEEESGDWALRGDPSIEAWRARTTREGYGKARDELHLARTVEEAPRLGDAVQNGDITAEHATVLARGMQTASEAQREALQTPEIQDDLLRSAGKTNANDFKTALKHKLADIDKAAHQRGADDAKARRFTRLTRAYGGFRLEAFLDEASGQMLRTALKAAAGKPAADDDRTIVQRTADALTTVAGHALDRGTLRVGGQVRPHVMVTLSAEQWAAWRTRGEFPGATYTDGTPLAESDPATLLCDAQLMRVVFDADSQVVDFGREKRTFTGRQRKSMMVRDGGCMSPGCGIPPEYCEGHHINEWAAANGNTNIDEGALFCIFHHHWIHRNNIAIAHDARGLSFWSNNGKFIGRTDYRQRCVERGQRIAVASGPAQSGDVLPNTEDVNRPEQDHLKPKSLGCGRRPNRTVISQHVVASRACPERSDEPGRSPPQRHSLEILGHYRG
ncbi:DUF222 domain-containing protein [Saxibacter everestensis]|uniref:DUF222 domain-containing protein n=1 Tax=Saxibacter everestensis TaxID=2909229 RepID=A0ABY8QSX7_9MICO|nr:DUF222 domain-containing protein [Brevibacteriaceae bacterium ZFBP1038]